MRYAWQQRVITMTWNGQTKSQSYEMLGQRTHDVPYVGCFQAEEHWPVLVYRWIPIWIQWHCPVKENRMKDLTKLHFHFGWNSSKRSAPTTATIIRYRIHDTIWNCASGKLIFHTITNTFSSFELLSIHSNHSPEPSSAFFSSTVSDKHTMKKKLMIEEKKGTRAHMRQHAWERIRRFAINFRSNLVMHASASNEIPRDKQIVRLNWPFSAAPIRNWNDFFRCLRNNYLPKITQKRRIETAVFLLVNECFYWEIIGLAIHTQFFFHHLLSSQLNYYILMVKFWFWFPNVCSSIISCYNI